MLDLLSGVLVLDLTSNVAGPFGTLVLGDLGATVVKVESPEGDSVRGWPPFMEDGRSATFAALNRGKRSLVIDLKSDDGRALLTELASSADVLIESMRPGTMDRLGVGWETLTELNPRLIYTSISAFGGVGPLGSRPGYDAIIQAYSGILNLTGEKDGPPVRVGTGLVDLGTGMWAALATVAALKHRETTGTGCNVSTTLLGTAVGFLVHHLASVEYSGIIPKRLGTAQHNAAPYEAIQASDGFVMVAAANDRLWHKFCDALGDDGRLRGNTLFASNADRVANRDQLVVIANEYAKDLTAAELVKRLEDGDVPSSAVRDVSEVLEDEQVAAMGLLQPWREGRLMVAPVTIDGQTPSLDGTFPDLGSDAPDALAAFGIPQERIEQLAEQAASHG